jgi:hypothetical protein
MQPMTLSNLLNKLAGKPWVVSCFSFAVTALLIAPDHLIRL